MYCRHCGQEVNDNAVVCIHCGCAIQEKNSLSTNGITECGNKSTLGLLFALFLGLVGLIIGICIYPSASYERETFIKGWIKGFVIAIVVAVVIGVFYGCAVVALAF